MRKRRILDFFTKKTDQRSSEIFPEEIFLDSTNLPSFDIHQFEGRMEKPISKGVFIVAGLFFFLIGVGYLVKVADLQIVEGSSFSARSTNNRLQHELFFAERGVITDRNGVLLAWNGPNKASPEFSRREYTAIAGHAHVLGYVRYPAIDANGFYYETEYKGVTGVEEFYNSYLSGKNGLKIIETTALGDITSENAITPAEHGETLRLSIDSEFQEKFYDIIRELSNDVGFLGGAAALMNLKTGEILAMTSYPEYSPDLLTNGADNEQITVALNAPGTPFLNRITSGLYTPGSIMKAYVALGALNEKIISPDRQILSTGSLVIPNIYDSENASVFNDWKAHGYVDMRRALAVSSNVYFYEIGGGYKDQAGLGITNIEKYFRMFGFGSPVEAEFFRGPSGTIPNPSWKRSTFEDDWRLGDTYNTAIGQYGVQVVPMQALIGVATIANEGVVPVPTIIKTDAPLFGKPVDIPREYFEVVKEGMRQGVLEGTAAALNVSGLNIAAKTGTAEIGSLKQYVNSWVTGFLPYDDPKYAFVVVMEKGRRSNLIGAPAVARQFFEWMAINRWEEFVK
ncbi:MAG: hypothetical protein A2928_04290 [Candidatus Taylorbacteria bacterium RIFCSPLOWO2_01_FULL_45_15b]|uniref:Penicillin-binding protein transpeptidase domain-containing protein n=1 Tax=Candidatus Taylorbacteria bacterium RIFCSPLOWO2_01_FULL_45_15b TaxID=1802319 RepID=A0A1G2NGP3_9BACT|nr:MAG: hypothetical protein A2928_04290 [Candidatus Taylorbacteria bacterium RIFCSPLOWO2_01_FULL_45_15b]